jgi:release factor glutamine methyltransferase
MKSILEVVQGATDYLTKHGVESARLNAEHLVAHGLGKKRLDLYLEFDRPLGEAELAPLRELLRRRSSGVPLQHLLGTVEFYGRTFGCDARGLVPRPETELLMERILRDLTTAMPKEGAALLDVGTGSGVIALTLAAELPTASVTAVDRSPNALALAHENAARLELTERVTFLESDLLAAIPANAAFDLIVANLPYIPAGEIAGLAREVQHDPVAALDGGPIGTELIFRLIEEARARLNPGGQIALEIGHDQSESVCAELLRQNYRDIRAVADYQDTLRFVFAIYG